MQTRAPAVAGSFYPADALELRATVAGLLAANPATTPAPKVLVVPHAGFVYSGPIAARAYNTLVQRAAPIERVVLLGPAHTVGLRGIAAPTDAAWDTPLGRIPLDRAALDSLAAFRAVIAHDLPHAREHSIEVQLPFLQVVLGSFALVPLCVGECPPEVVARVVAHLWGGPETLIVVSTDLSHYHAYAEAQRRDTATAARVLAFASDLGGHDCCGCRPLNGVLALAKERHMQVTQLDLRNSGDTSGSRDRVVGYGAWSLHDA